MTFYEKLEEKAKEMGFSSMTKFFDTAEVNTNARQALKKTGRLSDTYKMRIARVLKCSVGDINRMMSEAQADALKKDWPEQATEQPTEDQILEEKIEEIKGKADVLLTYHDRIKGAAEAELAADYAQVLRKRMLAMAMQDLRDLCTEFVADYNPNKAAAFVDVASEILKLKGEEQ